MKRTLLAAAVTLGALSLAPASALAHSVRVTADCATGVDFHFSYFGGAATAEYKIEVDGVEVDGGKRVLFDGPMPWAPAPLGFNHGSEGWVDDFKRPLPEAFNDHLQHTLKVSVGWKGAVDNRGVALELERVFKCEPTVPPTEPPVEPPPTTPPTPPTIPDLPPVTIPPAGNIVNPPSIPNKPVKKQSTPVCSSVTAKGYRVRAKQSNTITVRVKTRSKTRPTVRLRGAGVSTSKKVNSKGTVTFKVKPRKSGRIRVTATGCGKIANVRVLGAKRSQRAGTSPTFTG